MSCVCANLVDLLNHQSFYYKLPHIKETPEFLLKSLPVFCDWPDFLLSIFLATVIIRTRCQCLFDLYMM